MEPQEELRAIPLSALQHWGYCPRQMALIHLDQVWQGNLHTDRGDRDHQRVIEGPDTNLPDGGRLERSLPLWSERLGLSGIADTVEFRGDGTLYPVEYKHGRMKPARHDDLQLAAQALCLEEMFGKPVPCGAIYHVASRRRREVVIDDDLRSAVIKAAEACRTILSSNVLPAPVFDRRCTECSLRPACLPEVNPYRPSPDWLFSPQTEPEESSP